MGLSFNEMELVKKSFSALFKVLCSVKKDMLRPSVQIREIFADELKLIKVQKEKAFRITLDCFICSCV